MGELIDRCSNVLRGHGPRRSIKETLQDLADELTGEEYADNYGSGDYILDFEAEIAEMFGKDAGVFMPSGTMAQQIALRIWCERDRNSSIALHPSSHLITAEHGGPLFLHNLRRLQFASYESVGDRTLTVEDYEALGARPGAILTELPYRPLGGVLPSWEELTAITDWARDRNIPHHMDGARIWQCRDFYEKSYAEIATLFESVYVSFYKDLGGLAGSMLMGPEDFITESRVWLRRQGGNLVTQGPLVAAAKVGLDRTLPQIDRWVERAQEIAAVLTTFDEITVHPDPPHTNMLRLYIRGDHQVLLDRHNELAEETGTFILNGLHPSAVPGVATTEMMFFENAMSFDVGQLKPFLERMLVP